MRNAPKLIFILAFIAISMVLVPIAASPAGRPEWREYQAAYYPYPLDSRAFLPLVNKNWLYYPQMLELPGE